MQTALIASNDLNNLTHLSFYLEQMGYYATIVHRVNEIKEIINSAKPDLIFLDIVLSGGSGFEVCRQLKSNSNTKKIPVVLISAGDNIIGQAWGKMLGAEADILKPINKEQLAAVLKQLMIEKS